MYVYNNIDILPTVIFGLFFAPVLAVAIVDCIDKSIKSPRN